MELMVLGADGSWPGPGGACSGYLLRHDGFNLWLDAGFGTLSRLQEYIALEDIGAIVISHPHRDHFVDLYGLFVAWRFGPVGKPNVPVYALPGFRDLAGRLISESSEGRWRETFDWREVSEGESFTTGPFAFTAFGMTHFGPTLGFRIEAGDAVLAYTADTGPTDALTDLARGAHTLLSEATFQDEERAHDRHMTAREAGKCTARAGVRRLVLTHIEPGHDKRVSLEQAAEEFDGEIVLAEPGLSLEIA